MDCVAYDTETDIRFIPGKPKVICVSRATAKGATLHTPREGMDLLLKDWAGGRLTVWTNAAFDMAAMLHNFPEHVTEIFDAYDAGLIRCTRVRSHCYAIATGLQEPGGLPYFHSLAAQVERLFDVDISAGKDDADAWRYRYAELADVPLDQWPPAAVKYAKDDASWTYKVWHAQNARKLKVRTQKFLRHMPDEEGLFPGELVITMSHFALFLSSTEGFMRDWGWIHGLKPYIKARTDEMWQQLVDEGLARKNTKTKAGYSKNLKALRARVSAAYNGNPPRTPPTPTMLAKDPNSRGNVKTSKTTLLRTGDELLILASGEGLFKVASTYLPALQSVTQELKGGTSEDVVDLRPSYSCTLVTGRTSVSGVAPLQQFPKKGGAREALVAEPGNALVMTDLSAAESVGLGEAYCQYLGVDSWSLVDLLRDGKDHHIHTAWYIADRVEPGRWPTYEDMYKAYEDGCPAAKKYRSMAKPVNHGGAGGLQARSFIDFAMGYGVRLTLEMSQTILDAWKDAQPEITKYFRFVEGQRDVLRGGYVLETAGVGFVRRCRSKTAAYNYGFQSLLAFGKRLAAFVLVREQWDPSGRYILKDDWLKWSKAHSTTALYGTRLRLDMHDEFVTECPEDRVHEVAKRQEAVMVAGTRHFMEFCGDLVAADSVAARRWTKQAKPVWGPGRTLEVWEGPRPECKTCTKPTRECPACYGYSVEES